MLLKRQWTQLLNQQLSLSLFRLRKELTVLALVMHSVHKLVRIYIILFAFKRQKKLVDHIHKLGAIAKLHICGDTTDILPFMIATGADIIDIDHMVSSMSDFAGLISPGQVFSGKADPVRIIQDGTPEIIERTVIDDLRQSGGRCIVSAGCEITPGTSVENMKAFRLASINSAKL